MILVAYGLGNAVGPFMWKAQYQPRFASLLLDIRGYLNFLLLPRNHIPWAIITACSVASALLLVIIRFTYATENKRRESSTEKDNFDEYYISEVQVDGTTLEKKVDRVSCGFVPPF